MATWEEAGAAKQQLRSELARRGLKAEVLGDVNVAVDIIVHEGEFVVQGTVQNADAIPEGLPREVDGVPAEYMLGEAVPHEFIDPDDPENMYCSNCGHNGDENLECTGVPPSHHYPPGYKLHW